MPRRYKLGADGQPHRAFYGKLPEEFTREDTHALHGGNRFTSFPGRVGGHAGPAPCGRAIAIRTGTLFPAGKENPMEKGTGGTPAAAPRAAETGRKRAGH